MTTEEEEYYVCHRVEDLAVPRPESITGRCGHCGGAIWIMPYAPTHMSRVCTHCFLEILKSAPEGEEVRMIPGSFFDPNRKGF